ncbi:DNA-binding transcriptional regulator YdaS (Cro superfamily) [Paraburkholderia phenoliruptrix]|uniref:transcriptional regulator n=1 Tax=Paraburkholderia phenoliruptrix TaxID=252970 RepID=UPI002864DBDF|nr:helix-turn-helix domain-containing protein [Paraburkholderia phenoliruptrix]MDR6421324.1 DNA-binding transcriptional regulator YdaS (Cro superfamily) [Paraburkholderia phenoliruptrix]
MNTTTQQAVLMACEILGSKSALARAVGVKPPTVQQWCNGERPVPPNKCIEIERATGRRVRVEQLGPDIDWAYIRDSAQSIADDESIAARSASSDDAQNNPGGTVRKTKEARARAVV